MNVRLLRKIQKHILAVPQRFDMTVWASDGLTPGMERIYDPWGAGVEIKDTVPECGTVCCIGGWAETLTGTDDADAALGLRWDQSERLFYCSQWPPSFKRRYDKAK